MSDALLAYFNRELEALRGLASEFAERHPKIAGRLRLTKDTVDDPHVSRLLEGVAFLGARVQHRLDDEFPELTDALLSVLYLWGFVFVSEHMIQGSLQCNLSIVADFAVSLLFLARSVAISDVFVSFSCLRDIAVSANRRCERARAALDVHAQRRFYADKSVDFDGQHAREAEYDRQGTRNNNSLFRLDSRTTASDRFLLALFYLRFLLLR